MTRLLRLIMSVGIVVALAGCAATDGGSTQRQASEQPGVAKVSSETGGEKAGCPKTKCCGEKAAGCCHKPCEKK
ncbi:MAG TPA: hypothetical protein PLL20_02995 [Phycisphaerae bacterium]|nr:hypothetical protein [Phycisphaerae bacterium]HRR84571.1 hypothetical protein [Phycisphaerae bacterium]